MIVLQSAVTSKPIWQNSLTRPVFPPLTENLLVDVAIVGAGITGITAAALLNSTGKTVALLEAHEVGSGDTGHTTAHLATVPDLRFKRLISSFGKENAQLLMRLKALSIAQIQDLVDQHQIDCDFRYIPGHLFSESNEDREELEAELEAARQCNVPASWMTRNPLPFGVEAGIRVENQGRFHVLKYLYGLLDGLDHRKLRVFEQTRVVEYADGEPCRLITPGGTVHAHHVILATHSPIGLLLSLHPRLPAYRSYAIAARLTSPVPDGLFWDTQKPYHYLRRFGADDERILIAGGADHKTGEKIDTEECYEQMEEYVRERFEVESIQARWSAQTFETPDGLPYIGRIPVTGHIYGGTGYGGNGMTFGTLAAMLLTSQILEQPDEEALALFDPRRIKPIASAKNFISENIDAAQHMVVDRLFKSHVDSVYEILPGQGRIVDIKGEKLAVYRTEKGELVGLSSVCTHAGCMVNWNEAEKTWDCPCHGSRYSATGEVIEAPALEPLKRVRIKLGEM